MTPHMKEEFITYITIGVYITYLQLTRLYVKQQNIYATQKCLTINGVRNKNILLHAMVLRKIKLEMN